jgi:hypothetical protein
VHDPQIEIERVSEEMKLPGMTKRLERLFRFVMPSSEAENGIPSLIYRETSILRSHESLEALSAAGYPCHNIRLKITPTLILKSQFALSSKNSDYFSQYRQTLASDYIRDSTYTASFSL